MFIKPTECQDIQSKRERLNEPLPFTWLTHGDTVPCTLRKGGQVYFMFRHGNHPSTLLD